MAGVTPSYIQLHPSYMMPELLLQYQQASGAFETLQGGEPLTRLGAGDLVAYVKAMDIRTDTASGQGAYNQLPSVSVIPRMVSTASYLLRVRAEYDHHDLAAFGEWGASLVEAQRLGTRQGIFQQMRSALLYGFNSANGEGLLNAQGATAVTLPADSNGAISISTYDNGQLAIFFLTQISALKTRIMSIGMPTSITILAPQRTIAQMAYQGIVQLIQYQKSGGGTNVTAGVVTEVTGHQGDKIIWVCDDTLINQGAGGTTDAILLTAPEVKKPVSSPINTNEFARLAPGLEGVNLQLCDMDAPREIPTPLAGGAIDVLSELRITSGWNLRPEALTIVSAPF
jgi:hypothetical protein